MENKAEIRLRGMLGFAMRAGRVTVGTDAVCTAMAKSGKDRAKLVLISSSASDGTKKKISTKAEFYGVDCFEIQSRFQGAICLSWQELPQSEPF